MAAPTWAVGQVLSASDVNTWFVPLAAYKVATTTRSSLSMTIDPDLQFTLAANSTYKLSAALLYSAASGGFSFTWTFPTGIVGGYSVSLNLSGAGSSTYGYGFSATVVGGTPSTTTYAAPILGMVQTGSTGGTFGVNWASATGPVSLTLGVGSMLECRRIG